MPFKSFYQICEDIRSLKIQGATNIAKVGVVALSFKGASIEKLISLRPTEPCLRNALRFALKFGSARALEHFEKAKGKIAKYGARKVRGVVFTHCHSSAVIDVLREAKKRRVKFEVYNTETRPKYQGRITAKKLAKAGIKVTTVVDAAAGAALRKSKHLKKCDVMLIGCDAVLGNGDVVNKIGSSMFAEIAFNHKIPVYVCTDSWKFDPLTSEKKRGWWSRVFGRKGKKAKKAKEEEIELRPAEEIWRHAPAHILIKNPAFEVVPAKFIKGIISELGILKPKQFIKKVVGKNKWMIDKKSKYN